VQHPAGLDTRAEYARYWHFFWPLALGAVCILAGQQAYNGVLARVGDPGRELAVYACAVGLFFLFDIGTAFMPNLVTVYARGRAARRRVLRFCVLVGALFTLPVLALGATAPGAAVVQLLYSLEPAMLADVRAYLVWLAALILLHVFHHYYNGLLILAERTRWVSVINVGAVGASVAVAIHGLGASWRPVAIIAVAEWVSGVLKLAAQLIVWSRTRRRLPDGGAEVPAWRELYAFFWPVCISGMSFGISRPLVFFFVARVPQAMAIIAAMRVAMDFLMLYQSVVNQFRHFFATFGLEHLAEKRRFMAWVASAMTAGMGAVLAIPAVSEPFFMGAIGLSPALYAMAHTMCVLLLVVPAILMVRNYYHGVLIVRRRTAAMASGSAARVLAIAGTSAALLAAGWLDARTAVLGMIAGFAAEMLIAWRAVRTLET
jgi:Na+-driven multidrug efflux pump